MNEQQTRLLELFQEREGLTLKQIADLTDYRKQEIYKAIVALKRKKLIKKVTEGFWILIK
ncbi:MarR family transcriptional regulator [Desulfonauticus submarinus]